MDEKVKNDEKKVMLVRQTGEGQDGRLKAVGSIDEDGNIETLDPTAANVAKLFDVNTNQPALEAFFTKFMEQSQDPVKTGISEIFIMAESVLNKLIRIDLDPQLLENYRVDPAEELAKMEPQIAVPRFEPMDISRIDTADMERMGIRMGDLEPHLKAMSYGHKSHGLIEMRPEMEPGGMRVTTKGRVSLEEQADGSLKVVPHYYREKCDLDAPFHNVLLDDEAKRNIVETRHAGKVIDLELEPGRMTPCYVSRDKWTNELVAMPVSEFDKRASIKNADLSEGEQLDFYSGRKILLKGYTTRSGYKRDAYIQIDASESNIEFDHSGLDKRRYQEHNREVYAAKRFEQGNPLPEGPRAMFIPKRVFGGGTAPRSLQSMAGRPQFPRKAQRCQSDLFAGITIPRKPGTCGSLGKTRLRGRKDQILPLEPGLLAQTVLLAVTGSGPNPVERAVQADRRTAAEAAIRTRSASGRPAEASAEEVQERRRPVTCSQSS